MADKRITELDPIPGIADVDLLPIVDITDTTTKKVTALQVKNYIGSKSYTTIGTNEFTDQSSYVLIGAFTLDASLYSTVQFVSTANVTLFGTTGSVQLFNLTDSIQVVVNSHTTTTPTQIQSSVLSLPSGNKVYEVRHKVTGGTPPTDNIITLWAGFYTT